MVIAHSVVVELRVDGARSFGALFRPSMHRPIHVEQANRHMELYTLCSLFGGIQEPLDMG